MFQPRRSKCCAKLVSIDFFGQHVEWLQPGSQSQVNSVPGAICTMIILATLIPYAIFRAFTLYNRNDYNVLTEIQSDFFTEDFPVDSSNGFKVAAALTAYGDFEDIEDPSIGTLEFYLKSWKDDGTPLSFKKLKTRTCTPEELNFEGVEYETDSDRFFPVHFKSVSLQPYSRKMKCVDEPYTIYGDFSTNIAASLMVTLERCDPELRECQDEAAFQEWMKFKYIILMENQEVYHQTKPLSERIERYARMSWNTIAGSTRDEKVKYITFQDVQTENIPIGVTIEQNEHFERIMTLEQTNNRIIPYVNNLWNSITYEVNHRRILSERVDYGFFEWLADIGGINGIFLDFLGPFVVILLVGDVSKVAIASQMTNMVEDGTDEGDPEGNSVINDCCLMLKLKLTCGLSRLLCSCCFGETRLERRIRQGQEMAEKELDVSFLLKRIHVLEGVIKEHFSLSQWTQKRVKYEKSRIEDEDEEVGGEDSLRQTLAKDFELSSLRQSAENDTQSVRTKRTTDLSFRQNLGRNMGTAKVVPFAENVQQQSSRPFQSDLETLSNGRHDEVMATDRPDGGGTHLQTVPNQDLDLSEMENNT